MSIYLNCLHFQYFCRQKILIWLAHQKNIQSSFTKYFLGICATKGSVLGEEVLLPGGLNPSGGGYKSQTLKKVIWDTDVFHEKRQTRQSERKWQGSGREEQGREGGVLGRVGKGSTLGKVAKEGCLKENLS